MQFSAHLFVLHGPHPHVFCLGRRPTNQPSEAQFMPQRSLTIECDQSRYRPLLSFNKAYCSVHSISDPELFSLNLCGKSFEYPHDHTTPCTNILPLECTSCTKRLEHSYMYVLAMYIEFDMHMQI